MIFGGVSWNKSFNSKKGVTNEYSCSDCSRKYKMLWARENHQKLCKQHSGGGE